MKKQANPVKIDPNRWYYDQLWREPFPLDRVQARQVRQALAELSLYPRRNLAQNPNLAVMEANHRAALLDIIAELDRTDLAALFYVARLLANIPCEAELFKRKRKFLAPTS